MVTPNDCAEAHTCASTGNVDRVAYWKGCYVGSYSRIDHFLDQSSDGVASRKRGVWLPTVAEIFDGLRNGRVAAFPDGDVVATKALLCVLFAFHVNHY